MNFDIDELDIEDFDLETVGYIDSSFSCESESPKISVSEILINYNEKFKNGLPAKYREKEVFDVISQLMMTQKSCSLLTGAPGTGKTKIVEEIARLIANKSPYTALLNNYVIYELPLSNLVSGSELRGQLEKRVNEVVDFCEKNDVILFIDEIHQLAGNIDAYESIAQMLKPAMARGSIKMIGATTLQESKMLLDDPAFNRRFNRVNVCELSIEQTKDIIEKVYLPKMTNHYGVFFKNGIAEVITKAAELSKTITCHRPDNAITMLDQICSGKLLKSFYELSITNDSDKRKELLSQKIIVDAKDVAAFNKEKLFSLPKNFDLAKKKVLLRDKLIDDIYESVKTYVSGSEFLPSERPFVVKIKGEKGSGKTLLAKSVAQNIDEQPVYIDAESFESDASISRIIGSPTGYVGSDSKKELPFDIIESNPRKVIVLDNLDKAPAVIEKFFKAAFESGVISYADNRLVDISKCIVFITTTGEKSGGSFGFVSSMPNPYKNEDKTEFLITHLKKQERIAAAQIIIQEMLSDIKACGSMNTRLPGKIKLSEADISEIENTENIRETVKRIVIKYICEKRNVYSKASS